LESFATANVFARYFFVGETNAIDISIAKSLFRVILHHVGKRYLVHSQWKSIERIAYWKATSRIVAQRRSLTLFVLLSLSVSLSISLLLYFALITCLYLHRSLF